MTEQLIHLSQTPVLFADGTPGEDPLELIGAAFGHEATWIAATHQRLGPDFFDLRSGVAGELTQKCVQYHLGLAVVGDIAPYSGGSEAVRSWVGEANRGRRLWFVADLDELEQRLGAPAGRGR
ncbi:DUF4180 domain-containing protein [Glycomyces tenuis]|uniref:DUF4180 domain-containing protein n=1 Tax=Glycomyces tenuis TaxID=58116 RepID=UPI00040677CB|nr:DUF4180 domain-containing protein [Glycomyces tenuis]